MKLFKNRTVIGVLCILLSLVICFGVTPLFTRSTSEKTTIVRVSADIHEGDEITQDMIQTVEVGAYNLPKGIMKEKGDVVGTPPQNWRRATTSSRPSCPANPPRRTPTCTVWTEPSRPSL